MIVHHGNPDAGSDLTRQLAEAAGQPLLLIDHELDNVSQRARELAAFIERYRAAVVNIVGPRASHWPEGYAVSRRIFQAVFRSEV